MSNGLSLAEFKAALPPQIRKNVRPETLQHINAALVDPEVAESIRDNIISHTSVMRDGKFKVESYINAVKYISYRMMNHTNKKAYAKTFPDKYLRLVAKGTSDKDIAAHVAMYNKGKLVNLIYEQTLIPSYILNANLFQKALNKQAHLMMTANSETVQTNAADSLLTHLKPPEAQKVELSLDVGEDSAIKALRESTLELVRQQRLMIESKCMTAKEIAEEPIRVIEVKADVDDE